MLDFPKLKEAFGNVDLVYATNVVARLKMVKSASEIACLRQAVKIAEIGIRAVHDAIDQDVTSDPVSYTHLTLPTKA